MGVEGVFPHLAAMEVETPLVDMALVRCVEVDMLSLYFSYIRAVQKGIMYKAFRRDATIASQKPTSEILNRNLVNTLHKKLLETFTQDIETVLHFDGQPTAQKARARSARMVRNSKNLTTINDFSQNIREIACSSESGPIPRARKRRLLRLNQQLKRSWGDARTIDSDTKKSLSTGLKQLGWNVCTCQGEADACIGRKADQYPGKIVVASADSDMLFYPLKTLLRKDTRNHTFTEYNIESLIQKLNVTTPQWIAAGIVTNNDYSGHLRGQSFVKNLGVVRSCIAVDAKGVLDQYCIKMNVDKDRYKMAADIFLDRLETTVEESSSNEAIDAAMKEVVKHVSIFLHK